MEFRVGDKVVHPQHGPGQITGIEKRGAASYYVIDILEQRTTLYVPVLRAGEVGMRAAMSRARMQRTLSILRGRPRALPEDHRRREEQLRTRLHRGDTLRVVGVVRDLTWRKEQGHLTAKDVELLRRGREILATEMALVSGDSVADASQRLEAAMDAGGQGMRT